MTIQLNLPVSCLVKMQDAEMVDGKKTGKWVPAAVTNKTTGVGDKQVAYISAHRRVILDAPRALAIPLRNTSNLYTIKVRPRKLVKSPKGTARWESTGVDGYIPPGKSLDVHVGDGQSAIIEEMPA